MSAVILLAALAVCTGASAVVGWLAHDITGDVRRTLHR